MEFLQFILTLAAIAVVVICIAKQFYAPMTLLIMSIVILFITTTIKDVSILGKATQGNMYIDIFEYVRTKFASAFTSNGIILLPIFGYATYMTKLNASKLLACLAIKPLKKIHAPYWVGIPLAVVIGAVLRLAITSQTGLNALFMVCIFPVLVAAGLSKFSAASVIILSTTFDWGPGDGPSNLIFSNVVGGNQTNFFIHYQLGIYPFAILAAILVAVLVNMRADKKIGFKQDESERIDELDPKSLGIPTYYALFPLLPLVFMIVFSDAVLGSITMSAFGSVVASLLVVLLFEFINKRNIKGVLKTSSEQLLGMGVAYGSLFAMISCAQVFAGAIGEIGGFKVLTNFLATLHMPGALLIALVGPCAMLVGISLGSSSSASVTFYPMLGDLAKVAGISASSAVIPLLTAVGTSRALSPISPAVILVSDYIGVDPLVLIKRNILPLLAYWGTATFIATVIFG